MTLESAYKAITFFLLGVLITVLLGWGTIVGDIAVMKKSISDLDGSMKQLQVTVTQLNEKSIDTANKVSNLVENYKDSRDLIENYRDALRDRRDRDEANTNNPYLKKKQ